MVVSRLEMNTGQIAMYKGLLTVADNVVNLPTIWQLHSLYLYYVTEMCQNDLKSIPEVQFQDCTNKLTFSVVKLSIVFIQSPAYLSKCKTVIPQNNSRTHT